jgi:acetylornithine deacetylase/succinyl-diaminopimelate desuccinylase-like protein
MAISFAGVDAYVAGHMPAWIDELTTLCAQPSVSARHEGIEECARLVAEMLRRRGFDAVVSPTDGHPIVLAHARGANPARTLLFYCHYDVQPPEPLELWSAPPFAPVVRDGALYARGAKDDKGELVARLAALDALRDAAGQYPCNITFLVDGEEEVGSPNLAAWFARHAEELRADGCIWEEGGTDADGDPLLSLGQRGLQYVELSVEALARDGHSGGAHLIPNAAWRLVWALATLKGPDERVRIPGFYDAARPPSPRQAELLAAVPDPAPALQKQFGLDRLLLGRSGAGWVFEPTCNIAGIGAGHQGMGAKTIVPARAVAKVDFRLVPDQDPADIMAKLRRHLDAEGFGDVRIDLLGGYQAGVTDPDSPLVRLAAETAEEVYGRPARLMPLMGGTTPIYLFTTQGVPVVNPGLGYGPFNNAHSPDEHVRLTDFERVVRHIARLVQRFGAGQD